MRVGVEWAAWQQAALIADREAGRLAGLISKFKTVYEVVARMHGSDDSELATATAAAATVREQRRITHVQRLQLSLSRASEGRWGRGEGARGRGGGEGRGNRVR